MLIAATAIIIKERKILLIKRSDYTDAFPNHWGLPGGKADSGESPEHTVIREVKEEVGLDFTPTKLFATGRYKERKLFRFLGEWDGEIKKCEDEIADFGWFSYADAVKLKLGFDYRDVIEKLHKEGFI